MKREKTKESTNREFKDGVFQLLFNDREKLLELFNALEGTDYVDPELINVETLESAICNRLINDLAFTVGHVQIILTEHQSTLNQNMPIRMLLYLAREYEKILELDKLHREKRYPIPTPHFYVLYNGEREIGPGFEMRLSESYGKSEDHPMLELTAHVININAGSRNPILERSQTLREYGEFVEEVRENLRAGLKRDEAIRKGIESCIRRGVLKDFLRSHGAEVTNAMFRAYTEEEIRHIYREDGLEEGLEEGKKELVEAMRKNGISPEDIAKMCSLSLEEVIDLSGEQEKKRDQEGAASFPSTNQQGSSKKR